MVAAAESWAGRRHPASVLLPAGAMGILANYPLVFFQVHPSGAQVGLWLGVNLGLLAIAVALGLWAAHRAGLDTSIVAVSRRGLVAGLGLGVVGIAWFAAVAAALGRLDFIEHELAVPMWVAVLGGVGASITEEIGYRLGIMTLLVWAAIVLTRRAAPMVPVMWAAILVSSALFGLGHLGTAGATVAGTASGLVTVVLATGGTGVLFGWLYWRFGLASAMLAHAVVDCVGTLVSPVLLPLLHRL